MDKYDVTKNRSRIMHDNGLKNNNASYARLILDKLKSSSPDFDRLCNDISEIQRLTKSGGKSRHGDNEVHLSSVDDEGSLKGKCGNCGKVCEYKSKECKKRKGNLHGGRTNNNNGGNSSNKTCNFCGLKGHKEEGCFKKFPDKAPSWYKENAAKTESASSNVEVSLTSLDPTKIQVDLKTLWDDMMAILH